ncbi:MAG: HD domain-containing protein [Nevskia sp.]|nr:HD domain-containing protein [Nevskia sp.]
MRERLLLSPGSSRRNNYDVTGRVRISHPQDVLAAVQPMLAGLCPGADLGPVEHAFGTFGRLYAGWLPGYVGCDTWYHDAQHGLDCALAMVRLLDGHERSEPPARRLGPRRIMLGVIIALFHDAGYIRGNSDAARNGAEYTLTHVKRSGEFLRTYLPQVGFAAEADLASRVVHFTGYEIALDRIDVADPLDRMLGFLLGTADVLAQTADRCYLEKCRDCLYREFEICGLAGEPRPGLPAPVYRSARELLAKTPDFNRKLWQERLDGYFGGVHRYLNIHFGGRNPYTESVDANIARVQDMIDHGSFDGLRLRPRIIGAAELREILGPALQPLRPVNQRGPRARAA